jgi:micrococcal nuclease
LPSCALNEGSFTIDPIDRDRDQYGRLPRTVTRDGESLGAVLWTKGWQRSGRGIGGVGAN